MEVKNVATVLVVNQDNGYDVFTLADAAEYMHEQITKALKYEDEAKIIFDSAAKGYNYGGIHWKFYDAAK